MSSSSEDEALELAAIHSAVKASSHAHCAHCFDLRLCDDAACPLVGCPERCGRRFHACKLEEHLLLCAELPVPCINRGYGCPAQMRRRRLGPHLADCPASLVVCSRERTRQPVSRHAKKLLKRAGRSGAVGADGGEDKGSEEEKAADVAWALDDQRRIGESFRYPKAQRKRNCDRQNPYHPMLPILREAVWETAAIDEVVPDSSDGEEVAEKKELYFALPPVCRTCTICAVDPMSQHHHTIGSSRAAVDALRVEAIEREAIDIDQTSTPLGPFHRPHELLLHLRAESPHHELLKGRRTYTLFCGRVLRRSEFPWHQRNQHAELESQLDGWALLRCPLAYLGCQFLVQRLRPQGSGPRRIAFHPLHRSLTFRDDGAGEEEGPGGEGSPLEQLPPELMEEVMGRLSSESLASLSLVSRRLRAWAAGWLEGRGRVEGGWRRWTEPRSHLVLWEPTPFRWSFSAAPDPVRRWQIASTAQVQAHLQICLYNQVQPLPQEKVPLFPKKVLDEIAKRKASAVVSKE